MRCMRPERHSLATRHTGTGRSPGPISNSKSTRMISRNADNISGEPPQPLHDSDQFGFQLGNQVGASDEVGFAVVLEIDHREVAAIFFAWVHTVVILIVWLANGDNSQHLFDTQGFVVVL